MPLENPPFRYAVYLKQHTPIIHYQADQDGATLRATEVRPKLDRFIIEQIQQAEGIDEAAFKERYVGWLVGAGQSGQLSLDYKLRIEKEGQDNVYVFNSHMGKNASRQLESQGLTPAVGPFFANMEFIKGHTVAFEHLKKAILSEKIKVTITCFHPTLLEKIKVYFPKLLIRENFGTRQSKGFGSFAVADQTQSEVEGILKSFPFSVFYKNVSSNIEAIFSTINKDYLMLKTGRNDLRNQRYLFPSLYHYYQDQEPSLVWEKKQITQDLIYPNEENKVIPNARFIRVLLGLAEYYSYPQNEIPIDKVCIKDSLEEINRFRSPLTFKVFGSRIYLLIGAIPDELYDRDFIFKNDRNPPQEVTIRTPPLKQKLDLTTLIQESNQGWRPLN